MLSCKDNFRNCRHEETELTKAFVRNRKDKDLKTLSELGHFLKGSSATLGLVKVRDGCEKIQRYGKNENLDGSSEPDSELCLDRIKDALVTVKTDYKDVERRLQTYYGKSEDDA